MGDGWWWWVKDGGKLWVQVVSWWEKGFFWHTVRLLWLCQVMELLHQAATYRSRLQSQAHVAPPATLTESRLDLSETSSDG